MTIGNGFPLTLVLECLYRVFRGNDKRSGFLTAAFRNGKSGEIVYLNIFIRNPLRSIRDEKKGSKDT